MRFKKHIFFFHCETEVQMKYNRSLQSLVGGRHLLRFRAVMLTKLARGQFTIIVAEHALSKYGVCIDDATYIVPFHMEDDEIKSQKRWVRYTVLRELLLRLIHNISIKY